MSALKGVRVLELANERIAFAGKLLADMGADVILIEPPGGDPARRYGPLRRRSAGSGEEPLVVASPHQQARRRAGPGQGRRP